MALILRALHMTSLKPDQHWKRIWTWFFIQRCIVTTPHLKNSAPNIVPQNCRNTTKYIYNWSWNINQSYFGCSLTRIKKLLKNCVSWEKIKPFSLNELLVPIHNCRGSVGLPFRHNQLCQLKQDLRAPFLLKQSSLHFFSLFTFT